MLAPVPPSATPWLPAQRCAQSVNRTAFMWFDGWHGMTRVGLAGLWVYAALIALLRISGQRALSRFNAFGLVAAVAQQANGPAMPGARQ